MSRVVVMGAGAWGCTFAQMAALAGSEVTLVCHTAAQAGTLGATRHDARHLGDIALPQSVHVTHVDDPAWADGARLVVIALPSRVISTEAPRIAAALQAGCGVLSLTKGLEPGTGRLLSAVWRDALGPGVPFAVLSGPNHAEEIAAGQPAAAVVSGDLALAELVQATVSGPAFRVYVNGDLVGVELCGAAKNVIALAAGMSDGLGLGDNAKAALITRGLAEMSRLGASSGCNDATFRGLAGMGDLVATCTSRHSRNRRAGELIATGTPADQVEAVIGQTVEGLATVRSLLARAEGVGVELPISAQVAAAAFEGRSPAECLRALMSRAPASEA
ncbi:MAG: NAD(P)-dependent glycerol-3-phosphate dehydrogenase [Actinomycetota bacterium]|nr:NAD(P)-dependent glycerol-3-phosphate dehydrogenase [Actinomycetota bacterium]